MNERENRYSSGVYPQRDISLVRGKGVKLYDMDGREYLDMGASYGVCNVGHCNESVVEAVRSQAEKLLYVSPTFYNDKRGELLERLASVAPSGLNRSFLCNSGTEAVEAALKFARASTGRSKIIAAKRSYHGRTMGALSTTWNPKYRKPFEPLVPDVEFIKYGDLNELEEVVDERCAAVILEPLQGESGVYLPPEGYFEAVRERCSESRTLLISDEIQTGFGRTGMMFGIDRYNVVPDILCCAKSLAGGVPIGAMIATDEVCSGMPKGGHGSTFSGNPLACAAGVAALDYLVDNKLAERAEELGRYFLERLEGLDSGKIREVRGRGLMIGVELKVKAGRYLTAMLEHGVIALPAGNLVVRFLPPLIVEKTDIDFAVDVFDEVL